MKKPKNRPSEPPVPSHLNSIWLEGTMVEEPECVGEDSPVWTFSVQGGPSVFTVEAGPRTVQACGERLTPGRRVRIIGRLFQRRAPGPRRGEVAIWGELLEPVTTPV